LQSNNITIPDGHLATNSSLSGLNILHQLISIFNKLWKASSSIGTNDLQLSKKEVRRIKLLNGITFTIIAVVLPSFVWQFVEYQLIKGVFNINSYLMLLVHFPVVFIYVLHHYKRFFSAKALFIMFVIITQGCFALSLGPEFGIHQYMILLVVLFVIFFDENKTVVIFSCITCVSFFLVQIGFAHIDPVLKENMKVSTKYVVFPLEVLLLLILLFQYRKEISISEETLIDRYNNQLRTFTTVASHDLKEPLRTIASFSSLLQMKNVDRNSEKSMGYLKLMELASKRMGNLLEDLISYSTADSEEIEMKEVDLNDTLTDVQANLYSRISNSGTILSVSKLPIVTGHNSQLVQLFQNLIGNSIKFTDENIKPQVKIYWQEKSKHHIITIEDNGIGMEKKYLNQIFDTFYRLNNKGEYEGSGLGLAICKKIADIHNIKINVSSTVGKGSTFKLFFKKT